MNLVRQEGRELHHCEQDYLQHQQHQRQHQAQEVGASLSDSDPSGLLHQSATSRHACLPLLFEAAFQKVKGQGGQGRGGRAVREEPWRGRCLHL